MSLMKKEDFDIQAIDKNLYSALKNAIYPGAKDESVAMVLSYCKARGLDPLQKPVHIVPMYVEDKQTNEKKMRDVIMPGIGLYRIQAQRSGQYAGQTDPEFGDDIIESICGISITYPKWCKVTVKKQMPNGEIVEFSSKEFWKENYASTKEGAPNAMWKKRPYAQLAKCAEAQALRKAFPDIIDQTPTAEEMEGKTFEGEYIEQKHSKAEVSDLNEKLGLTPKYDLSQLTNKLNDAKTLEELETEFKNSYKLAKSNSAHINVLTEIKDKRKLEFNTEPTELDKSWEEFTDDKL